MDLSKASPLPHPKVVFSFNWFDALVYKLFYWRWNNQFKNRYFLRSITRFYLKNYENIYREYHNDTD